MNKTKKCLKRAGFLILFIAAFYTTWLQITGVHAQNLLLEEEKTIKEHLGNYMKSAAFHSESNPFKADWSWTEAAEAAALDEHGPPADTFKGKMDLSRYPVQEVTATGYTAGFESTGKTPASPTYGITYSGVKVKRDLYSTIAADLNVFPIGTILYIPGYGYGVVADKGAAIKGNKLDLFYNTVADVYADWGKKTLDVYIIEKGQGALTEQQLAALNENKDMQVLRQQILGKSKK